MARTVLIADPDDSSRERVAGIAHELGYRVLKAQTAAEASCALDACPISVVLIDEDLLRRCDLRRLLLRAQVIVLSRDPRKPIAEDVAVVFKEMDAVEMARVLVDVVGDPRFPGPRAIVALLPDALDGGEGQSGAA